MIKFNTYLVRTTKYGKIVESEINSWEAWNIIRKCISSEMFKKYEEGCRENAVALATFNRTGINVSPTRSVTKIYLDVWYQDLGKKFPKETIKKMLYGSYADDFINGIAEIGCSGHKFTNGNKFWEFEII